VVKRNLPVLAMSKVSDEVQPTGGSEEAMRGLLDELPRLVNRIFDLLDLIVVRVALLGLAALGAYSLLSKR
jgi:hypothetical protein